MHGSWTACRSSPRGANGGTEKVAENRIALREPWTVLVRCCGIGGAHEAKYGTLAGGALAIDTWAPSMWDPVSVRVGYPVCVAAAGAWGPGSSAMGTWRVPSGWSSDSARRCDPIERRARAGREGYVGSGSNTWPGEATKWKSLLILTAQLSTEIG